jgi:glucosyl-3-phosphoglycerate synthase
MEKISERYTVMVPLTDIIDMEAFVCLANAIAKTRQGRVILLYLIQADLNHPLNEYVADVQLMRCTLDKFQAGKIKIKVRVVYDVPGAICEEASINRVNVILFHWHMLADPEVYQSMARLPCGFVVMRLGEDFDINRSWRQINNILMPIRGGAQSALNLRVATALNDLTERQVTPLHTLQPDEGSEKYQRMFNYFIYELHNLSIPVTIEGETVNRIMTQVVPRQVLIMGTPLRDDNTKDWLGDVTREISDQFRGTFIIINKHKEPGIYDSTISIWGDRPLAVIVDRWFSESTFHSREFKNIERLMKLKEAKKLKISLALPALNEEKTIGKVIKSIKTPLMDDLPLLDEIILIDSDSTDRTREIALDLGIPVYIHQEILPRYGQFRGKGEALWKSLYVLKGDIIVWIDTDITNIGPRFVYGVLGPLLKESHIQYVKGYYRRPLKVGDKLEFQGGGRVTELTARPLLNLFYPELSGIIQPLSGEYAGRRTALEQVPFFTGYGVETGLLLDLYRKFGLQSIAQVDLVERIHRNQSLISLSKMSFAIIQTVVKRLEEQRKFKLLEDMDLTMNLIRYAEKSYWLETETIKENERPPMREIPEYAERFLK